MRRVNMVSNIMFLFWVVRIRDKARGSTMKLYDFNTSLYCLCFCFRN